MPEPTTPHHVPSGPFAAPIAAMCDAAIDHDPAVPTAEAVRLVSLLVAHIGPAAADALDALDDATGVRMHLNSDVRLDNVMLDTADVLPTLLAAGAHLPAWRYYLAVMDLAHQVVAVGLYPTAAALAAIDVLRRSLLTTIDDAGARPSAVGAVPPAAAQAAAGTGPADRDAPVAPAEDIELLLTELDELVGLEEVKVEVRRVADRLLVDQLRRDAGLVVPDASRHLVFVGNPGTGKTTVARLVGRIYAALGVVARGHLVETDRDGLVAGFVGQTAAKVTAAFDEADEGVLLIDEAYSLARGGERDFGREAIDQIVKLAEDRRDRVVVILAGYTGEMAEMIAANPGMTSRFPKTLTFADYDADELAAIAELIIAASGYQLTPAARTEVRRRLEDVERVAGFGNGRYVRNLVEDTIDRQASRIAPSARAGQTPDPKQLSQLRKADLPPAAGG